ncbi:MAG: hypothetical protein FWH21_00540 [Kiritimatiellaeota bacterium]|nr:hypothetical protein [Kiritimatiellota bacterium]
MGRETAIGEYAAPGGWVFRVSQGLSRPGERLFTLANKATGIGLNIKYLIEEISFPTDGLAYSNGIYLALSSLSYNPACPIPKRGDLFQIAADIAVPVDEIEFTEGEAHGTYVAAVRFAVEGGGGTETQLDPPALKPDPGAHPWFEWAFDGDFSLAQDNGGVFGMYVDQVPINLRDLEEKGELVREIPSGEGRLSLTIPTLTSGEPILNIPGRDIPVGRFKLSTTYIENTDPGELGFTFGEGAIPAGDKPDSDWMEESQNWTNTVGTVNDEDITAVGLDFPKHTLKCVGVAIDRFRHNYSVRWPNNTRDPFGRLRDEVFYRNPSPSPPSTAIAFNRYGALTATKAVRCVRVTMHLEYRRLGFMQYVPNKSVNHLHIPDKVNAPETGGLAPNSPVNGMRVPSLWLDGNGQPVDLPSKDDMLFIPVTSVGEVNDSIAFILKALAEGRGKILVGEG